MDQSDRLPILELGEFDVDRRGTSYISWMEYGALFLPSDAFEWTFVVPPFDEEDEEFRTQAHGYRRRLRTVIDRLDLMGYSLDQVRRLYEGVRDERAHNPLRTRFPLPPTPSFDALSQAMRSLDVAGISRGHARRGKTSPWRRVAAHALQLDGADAEPSDKVDPEGWYQIVLTGLDTFTILQMLAQNDENLGIDLTWWAFNEVLEDLVGEEDYEKGVGAHTANKVLIVTEGSSDTAIIAKAFELLRPQVRDFFEFVDMESNYPFTGVGNLYNFYQGLLKIGIQNNVLFIFDNDTAGSAKFDAARSLQPLPNLGIMKLPDLPDLQTFETVGPTGVDVADISGRASSIECFLDHSWKNSGTPRVRWTGYFTQTDSYQGELTDKKAYVKDFLALGQKDLPHYDVSKLQTLLDAIRSETRKIGAARVDAFWFEG